jgi:p-hydroxybenzoate 3-monooxygenase
MRTQVAIVGAGPAGTLLAHLLHRAGVDNVVVERQSRQYVVDRVRAGVLEWGTVQVLRDAGVADNMDRLGRIHNGAKIAWAGRRDVYIDIAARTGRHFMAYGQSPLQKDLYDARDAMGGVIIDSADEVLPHDVTGDSPSVTYRKDRREHRITADFVVGCDGYHGVCRTVIPANCISTYEKDYPFGWLGVLAEVPPLDDLVYCNSPRGFALASQRNANLSRYYVQCPLEDTVADWPDERFWNELKARFPPHIAEHIVAGPTIEKSIAPLRSFVAEPLRYGSLFLAGDAAHIVPPTGAKGLNLAVSDVHYLSRGLINHYVHGDDSELDRYSEIALRRIWGAVRFSWWLTILLHRLPDQTDFEQRAREAELDYITSSEFAEASLCEQYAGMPFEPALEIVAR